MLRHTSQSALQPAAYSKIVSGHLSLRKLALLTMKLPVKNSGVMQIFLYLDRFVQSDCTQLLLRMLDLF